MGETWNGIRQRQFPKEFRIAPALPAELRPLLERIGDLLDRKPAAPGLDEKAVVEAATGLWRAERKLQEADPDQEDDLLVRLRLYVDSASDALSGIGVKVIDHDGEHFDDGMSVDVLAIEPQPGLTREVIVETLQPTIYLDGRRIHMAQVIVGRPEQPAD